MSKVGIRKILVNSRTWSTAIRSSSASACSNSLSYSTTCSTSNATSPAVVAAENTRLLPKRFSSVAVRYDDDDDDDAFEYARVRRRGRRYYDDDREYMETEEDYDDDYDDDIRSAADRLEEDGIFDGYDEDYDDYDEEISDKFSNVVIPNPILDRIDPDGAAERFPELASDWKFWVDMFLFIAVLNFLSTFGPRNPWPDLPIEMAQAGLPPPGI
mmetsp:Transcript_19758/g.36877  ORF Transcript_19758/g.36877 Transcript_19758/m.36877 type:complete len:214 (-) Transcript_19758:583-1224(-)